MLPAAVLDDGPRPGQGPGDERRRRGDGLPRPGTSGAPFGLSGPERQAVALGWGIGMAVVTLTVVINIVTETLGPGGLGLWRPVIWEVSSWVTMTLSLLVPAGVAVWLRRRQPAWWQAAAMHVAALAVYFLIHVGGFFVLRKLAYAWLLGDSYAPRSVVGGAFYEAAKDVPAYAFAVAAFWLALRWLQGRGSAAAEGPAWFDIRDGARILRVPVSDILAVRSAGNYVEFLLGDGRSPLMRAALSSLEPKLAAHGFVRTHRSWLVNAACMSGLRPDGSGDYTVELGALEAPLSRRFREALPKLRG